MIDERLLEILRCPIDPRRETRLVLEADTKLFCARCRVQFRTRDGFASLVAEEATLPDGCDSTGGLPCQTRSAGR
jgi:uncharacterized protein YbaR (Trm112 family)